MRLRRLDLLRYGHFTDRSVELPAGTSDLHIVFGPNETGKSTALMAIEDVLFGIPARSPYGFLHDYKSMRIGAVLESDGSALEFRRRKGTKDTLLDVDELPMAGADGVLRPFLESADRAFFERMFSLDHQRLEQGGREILSASDEVGQILFSAGAGIAGLRDRLSKLTEEADSLWGARRAGRRLYTQAEDRLKEAETSLREQTLTSKDWNDLRREYEEAEKQYGKIESEIQTKTAEAKRLGRIRRVYRYVRRKLELQRDIDALGVVVALPEQAAEMLETAARDESIAGGGIDTVKEQLNHAREDLDGLTYDEALVARAADVRALNENRVVVEREKVDLPKRQAELEVAENELRTLARELEWREGDVDELIERIPARSIAKAASSVLSERRELAAAVAGGAKELQDANAEMLRLQKQLEGIGESPDASRLSVAVRAVRGMGDLAERARTAEQRVRDRATQIQTLVNALNPAVSGESALVEMKVPAAEEIQNHRDGARDWQQRRTESQRQIEEAKEQIAADRLGFEQTVRDEHAITADQLASVREERDALWNLVRLKHIEGSAIPEEERVRYAAELEDLPAGFEAKSEAADEMADDRFENAEASGRLAQASRAIELQEDRLRRLQAKAEDIETEHQTLDTDWRSMWETAPLEPLSPDAMLEWLRGRNDVLDAIDNRIRESGDGEDLETQEREAKECLLVEMAALGVDRGGIENDHLRMILESAADLQQRYDGERESQARLREAFESAGAEVERRQGEAERADSAWDSWEGQWSAALDSLGLSAELSPAAIEAQIEVIDQMRDVGVRINNLRHERIAKINRDIAGFESLTKKLTTEVASDLVDAEAAEAALQLQERLGEAERFRDLRRQKHKDVTIHEEKISQLENATQVARRSLRHLHETAATDSVDALRTAVEKSDERRTLEDEFNKVLQTLENEGDGLRVEELEEECAAVDVDEIAAVEGSNATELEELGGRRTEAAEARSQARTGFESIGGDDAAARAAAARQEALTDMGDAAARYARVRTSVILLQWAIDRYRREKQAPLLKRAGELFAGLTEGSFSELRVDYDDGDEAHLIGIRPGGEKVAVSGMSSGTADQLYLALRVAAVDEYLDRSAKLPFVADDLFINFDDTRAAAGFEVLSRLAEKTQVLFFTHHQHLVDVARNTLGESVHVVSL